MSQTNENQNMPGPNPTTQQMVRVGMPATAPYLTYTLIVVTVIFYILQVAILAMTGNDIRTLYGARINEAILAGELWRFITPALLHASIPHLLFNMYALFSFGTGLERHFGHGRFFLLYVVAAFTGNVFSFLFSEGYSVGASTAIFGLLGAEAVFLFQNRELFAGNLGRAIQNVIFNCHHQPDPGFAAGNRQLGARRRPDWWPGICSTSCPPASCCYSST